MSNLEHIDRLKVTYEDIVNGLDLAAPKWAKECYEAGFKPVSALDFYTDVFPLGSLAPHREIDEYSHIEDGKRVFDTTNDYSAIAIEVRKATEEEQKQLKKKAIAYRHTITDGCDELFDLISNSEHFIQMPPASYCGKRRLNVNGRFLYALAFEIDNLYEKKKGGSTGFEQLCYSWERLNRRIPVPTYIVCSGTGLHLYYVFDKPVPLFPNVKKQLEKMRHQFIKWAWDGVSKDAKIQYEHLLQGYRVVGSRSKGNTFAMAFKVGETVTLQHLNNFVTKGNEVSIIYKSNLRLDEAKTKFPEWYENRIVKGRKAGFYVRDKGCYDNWISKIYDQATVGHRYNAMVALVALGTQCGLSEDEVRKDCHDLLKYLDSLTIDAEHNPFTEYDIECAMEFYGDENCFHRKIEYIEDATGIRMERTKRNGRSQKRHISIITMDRDDKYENGNWRENNGAKPKWVEVQEWRKAHPNGKKIDCARDTGLSRPTVSKWWNIEENPIDDFEENIKTVQQWQMDHKTGTKYDCHKETGISKYYIDKAWRTGAALFEDKIPSDNIYLPEPKITTVTIKGKKFRTELLSAPDYSKLKRMSRDEFNELIKNDPDAWLLK